LEFGGPSSVPSALAFLRISTKGVTLQRALEQELYFASVLKRAVLAYNLLAKMIGQTMYNTEYPLQDLAVTGLKMAVSGS
jgi:hypothetical protein